MVWDHLKLTDKQLHYKDGKLDNDCDTNEVEDNILSFSGSEDYKLSS